MDTMEKVGRTVGDVIDRATGHERARQKDRLDTLDKLDAAARELVLQREHRHLEWEWKSREAALAMISHAAAIGDEPLAARVDALVRIGTNMNAPVPRKRLDTTYRSLVARVAEIRHDTLGDE